MKDIKKRKRVSILKADRNGPGPHPKEDWTTAYINNKNYAELLELAFGDDEAINRAFRLASERLVKRVGRSWSATCLVGARTLLKKAQEMAAAAAAANNSVWDAVQ